MAALNETDRLRLIAAIIKAYASHKTIIRAQKENDCVDGLVALGRRVPAALGIDVRTLHVIGTPEANDAAQSLKSEQ